MDKRTLLDRFAPEGESRVLFARILDQAQRSDSRSLPTATPFLTPAQQAGSADLLMAAYPGAGFLFGGYEGAERQVWVFLPHWMERESWQSGPDCPVKAVEAALSAPAPLTHRDWLGSLMGLGLSREKLGDILLSETGGQVLVLEETLPILLTQWDKVGRVPVQVREIPLSALTPTPGKTKLLRDTVSSLRLDGVLASAFSLSRSRAAELIRGGRVSVNHLPCQKGDKPLTQGDVLTCRGLGKSLLKTVGGQSRKGRIIIEIERYL